MERLTSVQKLQALRSALRTSAMPAAATIVIPAGTCGRASGAGELVAVAREILAGRSAGPRLRVTGCHGFCQMEPSVLVEPSRTFYRRVKPKDMPRIIEAVGKGELVEELLCIDPDTKAIITQQDDLPFYRRQQRAILSRNEQVDPTKIESYLEAGGYTAVSTMLTRGDPGWVLDQVKASGLRGRGGAGFPTGVKWELLARQSRQPKFLVCNADEGDPGAYMDRSLLEGNPHAIIEGMLVGAFATGAREGFVYVRNEYPLAIEHLTLALRQAREVGLLGEAILGTGFSFDLSLVRGAGAFVCGEETALLRSIEGKTGEPRQRPPFPIDRGIEGNPTAINNVETWANVVLVLERGADAFAKIGTRRNSGTKIFSLVGKVKNTGLVEIPMGMTLAEITEGIGGGPSGRAPIKAVQTGGPSGGCIPAERFDLPVDYDSLTEAGSIMGSGGMIVMDEQTCMVDVARYFMRFLKEESCGKCFTCRKGTQRLYEILDGICCGEASKQDLSLLWELAQVVKDTTQCGLGQTAANPVLSTLRYFNSEYLAHIERGQCPAGVCKALITFAINDQCLGCGSCRKACSQGAISGERKQRHRIDPEKCNKCGSCRSVCKTGAVTVA